MTDEHPSHEAAHVQVQYQSPPASVHSNCLLVQGADCMYLHFFQIRPPVVMASGEAQSPVGEPVASIAVSFDRMQEFIDVMQQQFNFMKLAMASAPTGGRFTFLDRGGEWRTEDSQIDSSSNSTAATESLVSMMHDTQLSEAGSWSLKNAIATKSAKLKIVPRALQPKH